MNKGGRIKCPTSVRSNPMLRTSESGNVASGMPWLRPDSLNHTLRSTFMPVKRRSSSKVATTVNKPSSAEVKVTKYPKPLEIKKVTETPTKPDDLQLLVLMNQRFHWKSTFLISKLECKSTIMK